MPAHDPLNERRSGRSVRLARWRTWKMPIGARGYAMSKPLRYSEAGSELLTMIASPVS